MESKPSRERRAARTHHSVIPFIKTASPRKVGKSEKPPSLPILVAGREVLGRELSIFRNCQNISGWVTGKVKDFDETKALHQIAYNLPLPEALRETDEVKPIEWACLGKSYYAWTNPSYVCPLVNPTFSPRFTPKAQQAVGQRVKIFWSSMNKWYQGKIVAFDNATGMHQVKFKDGDTKPYRLSQEAIVWLDIPELSSGAAIQKTRAEEGDQVSHSMISNDENKPPEKEAENPTVSAPTLSGRKKARKDKADAGPTRKITRRQFAQAAAQAVPKLEADCKKSGVAFCPDVKEASQLEKKTPEVSVASKTTKQISKASNSRPDPASPNGHMNGTSDAGLVKLAKASSSDAKSASSTSEQIQTRPEDCQVLTGKSNGNCGFNVRVHCAEQDLSQGASALLKSPATSRKRIRQVSLESPKAGNGPSPKVQKIARGPVKVVSKAKPAQRSKQGSRLCRNSVDLQFVEACEAVKGCRVGVWWPSDKCYYKGQVKGYDSCHRTLRIEYDDGITERTPRLESCKFLWLSPRAVSAGATVKLHCAFQHLGAINATDSVKSAEERQSVAVDIPVKLESQNEGLHPSRPKIEPSNPVNVPQPSPPSMTMTQQSSQTVVQNILSGQYARNGLQLAHLLPVQALNTANSMALGHHLSHFLAAQRNGTPPGPVLGVHQMLQAATYPMQVHQVPMTQAVESKAFSQASSGALPPQQHVNQNSPSPSPPATSPAPGAAVCRQQNQNQEDVPSEQQAVGWMISMPFRGNGQTYQGRIISFKAKTGKHRVLWEDGEDEWLTLADEDNITWLKNNKKTPGYATGLPEGVSEPTGKDLVGWKVAVYWDGEGEFFEGIVDSLSDETLNEHSVSYCDGENKIETLSAQIIKFILPPSVKTVRLPQIMARKRSEVSDFEQPVSKSTSRKKARARVDESSEEEMMMEEEEDDDDDIIDEEESDSSESQAPQASKKPSCNNLRTFMQAPRFSSRQTISRMASGRGSLLQFTGEEFPSSPVHSPMSAQGSMGFGSAKCDGKGRPVCVKTVSGLKSVEGFRVGVKRVRIFLNAPEKTEEKNKSAPPVTGAQVVSQSTQLGDTKFAACPPQPKPTIPATLRNMLERVELATRNIRNGMPLDPKFSTYHSIASSRPSSAVAQEILPVLPQTQFATRTQDLQAGQLSPKANLASAASAEEKDKDDVIILSMPSPRHESLTPPPSPFSRKFSAGEPSDPKQPPALATPRPEVEDVNIISMSLPQTPSAKFEKTNQTGSILTESDSRVVVIEDEGPQPPLDVQQKSPQHLQ